jgi:peptidoglycan hydrolase-like protein with peptidoglycan-binding domain
MQYSDMELRAQQLVLAFLGFYNGMIDGIWSGATIKAMQAFECDDKFLPAVPTTGYPFAARSRLPKGMYWDKNLVAHVKLTPEIAAELLQKRSPRAAAPVVETPVEKVVETEVPVVEEQKEPVVETPVVEVPKVQTQQPQQNHQHRDRNDRQRR